jgi:plasmid stabilization system protein ParE
LKDLAEIIGHIAEDDVEAAARFGNSLVEHVDLLRQFPHMAGTIRGRSWVRKLVHSPILVYYQAHDNRRLVEVLHLSHG